jgi:hypothetical protein
MSIHPTLHQLLAACGRKIMLEVTCVAPDFVLVIRAMRDNLLARSIDQQCRVACRREASTTRRQGMER